MGVAERRYLAPAAITRQHELDPFDSGAPALDQWLKTRALDNEGRASRTYVVACSDPPARLVVAYYTLATGSVLLSDIHRRYRHNLPGSVPVIILGRLAVDRDHQGVGLGRALLRQAMRRTLEMSSMAGVRMMLVHAIDDEAASFYAKFGLHEFPTGSRTLFLPVEAIAGAL